MKTVLKKNRSLTVVALCLVVILISGFVSLGVLSDNGKFVIKEVTISPYGGDFASSMFIPKYVLDTDQKGNFLYKVPAVIVNSGFTNARTYSDNVAIELARCGFAVIEIDMYGHGHSDSIDNAGFASPPSPMADDVSLCGATAALDYLRTLGFVDQTKIGICGHSLGGSGCGRLAEKSAGFYTLQDKLFNMLNSELGVTVTASQIAAQNADAVAKTALNADKLALYESRKKEITKEDSMKLNCLLVYDSGAAGCDPKAVKVAGISVWRDIQVNAGLAMNMSGNGSKGLSNKDAHLSSAATVKLLSVNNAAERDVWYKINVSGNDKKVVSTKLSAFYSNSMDPTLQEAAKNHTLRMLTTPYGWHGMTFISSEVTKASVQFFSTVFGFYNPSVSPGNTANSVSNPVATTWVVKEVSSAIGLLALLVLILPLVDLLMKLPFFASMKGTPQLAVQSRKSPIFWIFTAIVVLVPAAIYSQGVGWAMNFKSSLLSTVQVCTQAAFWAAIMTCGLLVLVIIKYFVYDKKKYGLNFRDMYGLRYSRKNVGKSVVLALLIFGFVALLLNIYYSLFGAANLKVVPAGAMIFTALSKWQYYSCLLYAIYFLPFYLFNSMVISSARFKDMSDKANTIMIAAINSVGMLILFIIQFFFGYIPTGKVVLAVPPGSSALVYIVPYFAIVLFVTAIFTRKIYLKTGSAIPGALLNTFLFSIPAVQAYMFYSVI